MGKKLDALLGRTFKAAKFKALVSLAISRLAVLRNQRGVRLSQARSDTAELLKLGNQNRALLRVEIVMREQNMLDAFEMIEGYCDVLIERIHLIETNRECPDELKEAISTLIFAASRCGDFPELQEIRSVFTSRYGKEFAARAVELRNQCGVSPKMIQKLSTRNHPSDESKVKLLQEIASENNITLDLQEETYVPENFDSNQNQNQLETNLTSLDKANAGDQAPNQIEEINQKGMDDQTAGSLRARKRYHDVASAAQAAFESAAYAAEAARAAVELSRIESQDNYSDGPDSPPPRRKWSDNDLSSRAGVGEPGFVKIHPVENINSDSEGDDPQQGAVLRPELSKHRLSNENRERSLSPSDKLSRTKTPDNTVFDESDDETGVEADVQVNQKASLSANKFPETKQNNASADSEAEVHVNRLNLDRMPISVRARRGNKW